MKYEAAKMNTQAIASHLNLAEELILEVQEWAKVLWVRIKGMRPKFVSKKVVKMAEIPEGYIKPYDQLANTLSALSGIPASQIFLFKEKQQAHSFAPTVITYHVLGGGSYSEKEVNQIWTLANTNQG